MQKKIRVIPVQLVKEDGEFVTSVSVASRDALVVISELAMPSEDSMIGVVTITENVDE